MERFFREDKMLKLLEYKTGWDYKIVGDIIEAHAPSTVRMECLSDCEISVQPLLHNGGRKSAKISISLNTKIFPLEYEELMTILLKKGDIIELNCQLPSTDKSACWNYWKVSGLKFLKLPTMYMEKHSRLGDSISFLVGLESICRENNMEAYVCRQKIYRDLLKCFSFQKIKFVEYSDDAVCLDELFGASSWEEFWLDRIRNSLGKHFGLNSVSPSHIPECNIPKLNTQSNIVCVQLDSRSAINLDLQFSKNILNLLNKRYNVKILGGMDSKKYLGNEFEYSFGDIEHEIKELYNCKFFVGVDSGIAHLAGILGVKSYIINLIEQRTVFNFFSGYQNMSFVSLDFLKDVL
jgi:hypothetical protein